METSKCYGNYPLKTVFLTNLCSLGIYGLGFYIIMQAGKIISILYLLYILMLEFRLLRYHCTNCYYYGKRCGFGKGVLSALLFSKGDPEKFASKKMSWKDMIPDMLVLLIPLITGIILLIKGFDIMLLAALLLMIILGTSVTGYLRGQKTCKHCRQRELGCPAEVLFTKAKE